MRWKKLALERRKWRGIETETNHYNKEIISRAKKYIEGSGLTGQCLIK